MNRILALSALQCLLACLTDLCWALACVCKLGRKKQANELDKNLTIILSPASIRQHFPAPTSLPTQSTSAFYEGKEKRFNGKSILS